MDTQRLKNNFAAVTRHGDAVALFFYSHLFLEHPELRDMFPVAMSTQRDRLLGALGRIVSDAANADSLVPFLRDLGKDHRKFGALAAHYPAVGTSLVATLEYFSGDEWTEELRRDWTEAYGLIAETMTTAAERDTAPAWWDATVIGFERRTVDIAVLRVVPVQPYPYRPGQSVSIECEARPRLWRFYSMANAPRDDGTLDFHVRAVDGGQVSSVLGRYMPLGSRLRLGPPVGSIQFPAKQERDMVLAAGGTGLAPLKAIAEYLAGMDSAPRVHLFFGASVARDLYDLPDLEKMAASQPWLTVTACVSGEPGSYEQGTVADVMARHGGWPDRDAYVCGPSGMVAATTNYLVATGTPRERVFVEDFG
jgi:NAD(P)H-flavin reductase/hemoglobin-like flavoprotein